MAGLSDAKRRVIERLKRVESATAPELANEFGLTHTALRQHLEVLESIGLVERTSGASTGRGRPPVFWRVTAEADDLFPDRHAELAVEVIRSIRDGLGDESLQQVLAARTDRQLEHYRRELPGQAAVAVRVRRLAQLRSVEGYLAEAVEDDRGVVLIEHHCPICEAAEACPGLCNSELELFRRALGDDVEVERTQHLLAGDSRCAYRITSVAS